MNVIDARSYTGSRPWEALDIERIDDATIRLHWTNRPYRWHINDGPEVFVVLDGRVEMRTRDSTHGERRFLLGQGDVFHAREGDEHVAHPLGEARILVIERAGSP